MVFLKNIPILGKILGLLSLVAIFFVCNMFYTTTRMSDIQRTYSGVLHSEAKAAMMLLRADRALVSAELSIADVMIETSEEGNTKAIVALASNRKSFSESMTAAREAVPARSPAIADLTQKAGSVLDNSCGEAVRIGKAARTFEEKKTSQELFLHECLPALRPLNTAIRELVTTISTESDAADARAAALYDSTIMSTYVILFCSVALMMGIAYFMSRQSISQPLRQLTVTMGLLADGDLAAAVPGSERKDEIGRMAGAVQIFKDNGLKLKAAEAAAERERSLSDEERRGNEAMRAEALREQQAVVAALADGLQHLSRGNLTNRLAAPFPADYERLRADFNSAMGRMQEALETVVNSAATIRSGAGEVAAAADDLSRRTEQQAASLEETTAATTEVAKKVQGTAQDAATARREVTDAKAETDHSGEVVRQAVEAMTRIEDSSNQIGQIVGVIDEIAFQTNLLALNAGVEAARAGDAGRGFAVVASEVRALAQRSAESAKEIKTLIQASRQQVEAGVALVGETGTALAQIGRRVGKINDLVAGIAQSAQDQSSSLHEIQLAVREMDQSTQQNAAMVEQSTAACHSMAKEASGLVSMMQRFDFGEAKRGAPAAPAPTASLRERAVSFTKGSGQATARKLQTALAEQNWQEF